MEKHIDNQNLEKMYSELFAFIRMRVSTDDDAQDILGDVMEKLSRQLDSSQSPDNLNAWMYKVTKNSIIDYYRSRKSIEELPTDLSSDLPEVEIVSQLSKCILPLIQSLPERYKKPVLLSEIEGMKQKDVAKELGLSLPAVKSQILRGREKLAQSIERCCTLHRNQKNKITDFTHNSGNSCNTCDD